MRAALPGDTLEGLEGLSLLMHRMWVLASHWAAT